MLRLIYYSGAKKRASKGLRNREAWDGVIRAEEALRVDWRDVSASIR